MQYKYKKIIILFVVIGISCCVHKPIPIEIVHIKDVCIVYATHERINQEWYNRGNSGEVMGFYIPETNTVWAEKTDHAAIGHEIRHLTDGNWHD